MKQRKKAGAPPLRRAVSMQHDTYNRAAEYAAAHDLPLSQLVEQGLEMLMTSGVPPRPRHAASGRDVNGKFVPGNSMRGRSRGAKAGRSIREIRQRQLIGRAIDKADRAKLQIMTAYPATVYAPIDIPISEMLHEDIAVAAKRAGRAPDELGEAAIVAMLEEMEGGKVPWCRQCLERYEHCDCAASAPAPRRAG